MRLRMRVCTYAGTELKGGMGVAHPSNLDNLPFRRAKAVVQCIYAGQLTGPWTIGELLLLRKNVRLKMFAGQPLIPLPPKKL